MAKVDAAETPRSRAERELAEQVAGLIRSTALELPRHKTGTATIDVGDLHLVVDIRRGGDPFAVSAHVQKNRRRQQRRERAALLASLARPVHEQPLGLRTEALAVAARFEMWAGDLRPTKAAVLAVIATSLVPLSVRALVATSSLLRRRRATVSAALAELATSGAVISQGSGTGRRWGRGNISNWRAVFE